LTPSRKALLGERAVLHEKLGFHRCCVPLPELITELNRHLRGWAKYFSLGYARKALRDINAYVLYRFEQHLQRRSQRGWTPRTDESTYHYFAQLGLIRL
jgi:RNA-directed DNA polymerase